MCWDCLDVFEVMFDTLNGTVGLSDRRHGAKQSCLKSGISVAKSNPYSELFNKN